MDSWKDVVGYEGLYLVSDKGEVMSLQRTINNGRGVYVRGQKILRPGKRGKRGQLYKFVFLTDGKAATMVSVHRLVAEAFLQNPLSLPEVNHKDKNTMNNAADNLEWCTRRYNIEYSKAKRVSQYNLDGEKIAEYKSIVRASEQTGIRRTAINNALSGWSKTAGGYAWRYETEE